MCQPDGLLIDIPEGRITIIEIKLQHTPAAWWQLEMLYAPVLSSLFAGGKFDFCLVEAVKWLDPSVPFPVTFQKLPDITFAEPGRFGVHICNPLKI